MPAKENEVDLLRASDIIQFAISAEKNQEKFYSKAADAVEDEKLKETFQFLADEESLHKKHFETMFRGLKMVELDKELPEGYYEYINALFTDIQSMEENFEAILERLSSVERILNFAINHEAEFLLYYNELRKLVPKSDKTIIDSIIEEERKHFILLTGIKANLHLTK